MNLHTHILRSNGYRELGMFDEVIWNKDFYSKLFYLLGLTKNKKIFG
jgi:hypothetical protein